MLSVSGHMKVRLGLLESVKEVQKEKSVLGAYYKLYAAACQTNKTARAIMLEGEFP